ncbi:MAG: hypothetical protein ACLTAC_34325 [Hungatella sp.]
MERPRPSNHMQREENADGDEGGTPDKEAGLTEPVINGRRGETP